MTDVRDSSTGLPERRRSGAPVSPGSNQGEAGGAGGTGDAAGRGGADAGAGVTGAGFPVRQPTTRLVQPGGRHRRPVPASLPEGSPALVLAVPALRGSGLRDHGAGDEVLGGAAAEIATVLRVDNPALDVRLATIGSSPPERMDAESVAGVLADAAAVRGDGMQAAIVVPLLTASHLATTLAIRAAIAASGATASVCEVFNTNAMLAEALHIRLADAGLARADRARMFSITTSADGIIVATAGGPEAAGAASITSVLLAARLTLPVLAASADTPDGLAMAAARLQEMGVTRVAIAPCVIGPELPAGAIESVAPAIGAKCAAPLGAHGNVIKLIAQAYGMALSQIEGPEQD